MHPRNCVNQRDGAVQIDTFALDWIAFACTAGQGGEVEEDVDTAPDELVAHVRLGISSLHDDGPCAFERLNVVEPKFCNWCGTMVG